MSASKITLYKTNLRAEQNYSIDDFSEWLLTKTKIEEFSNSQYIKHGLDIEVKVDYSEYQLDCLLNSSFDYVAIVNVKTDILPTKRAQTFYYFITSIEWKGESTLKLNLHLDVLNTFKCGLHYSLDKKSFIKREHKDRFIPYSDVKEITYKFTGSIPALGYATIVIQENSFYHRVFNDIEPLESSDFHIHNVGWTKSYGQNGYYIEVKVYPSEAVSEGTYNLKFKLIFSDIIRKIDLYSEEIGNIVFKKEDYEVLQGKDDMSYYLFYKNANAINVSDYNIVNPVDCFLLPEREIPSKTATSSEVLTSSLTSGTYLIYKQDAQLLFKAWLSTHMQYAFYCNDSGIYHVITNIKPSNWDSYGYSWDNGAWYIIRYAYSFFQEAKAPLGFAKIDKIEINAPLTSIGIYFQAGAWNTSLIVDNELSLPPYNTTITFTLTDVSYVNIISSLNLDKTDSRNIKLLKLPYSPSSYEIDTSGNYEFAGWQYDSGLGALKLADLHAKFYNCIFNENNYFENIICSPSGISESDARNDYYESKLFHSDFYRPHFYYDSFSKDFALERLSIEKYLESQYSDLQIEFICTSNIQSKFLFKFPQYQTGSASGDYDNVLAVARNNEEALYSYSYINYLRTGYNYDVKNKERNLGFSWGSLGASILGTIASVIGGGVLGGGVGAIGGAIAGAVGISTSIINLAKSTAQSEANINEKLDTSRRQAVAVNNVDDIDLLSAYSNNKARISLYTASDKLKKQVADLFYYYGYIANEFKSPSISSRIWFNYVEGDVKINSAINVQEVFKNALAEKFKEGITFFHARTISGVKTWDLAQEKENYENWLLEE